ncbi:branched-chain amino acid transport system II carrier protein [Parashewanella spongiae]|uniref:Branched-chain amino acid transport system carrier protein n=2 Tax=Parashewanella spongiae TaxID=342950 RepID=A0A3A6U483_9GAMM|nr:branched-chain amino acid transport system II carrier protein [Parashewanella spongiae]
MAFGFIFGAGNLIYPSFIGFQSGSDLISSMTGFLISSNGLTALAFIAIAKNRGELTRFLPQQITMIFTGAIFITLGPLIAGPRTALVTYAMSIKPFISYFLFSTAHLSSTHLNSTIDIPQVISILLFFALAMLFALSPGKLIDNIGKKMTPILLCIISVICISVYFLPNKPLLSSVKGSLSFPFVHGLKTGYATLDGFCAPVFGSVLLNSMKEKGLTNRQQSHYLIKAAIAATIILLIIYVSLFFVGASVSNLAEGATNGGQIISIYTKLHFSFAGELILASVVLLSCLTTAIGLIVACAELFEQWQSFFSYHQLVIIVSLLCALTANIGLDTLMTLTMPVLTFLYPLVISMVAVTLIQPYLKQPALTQQLVFIAATIFGLIDCIETSGFHLFWLEVIPYSQQGMSWILPTVLTIFSCLMLPSKENLPA